MTVNNTKKIESYFTPVNDSEENCERTCAELRIYSGEMRPSEVTDTLGISPTDHVALGEPKAIGSTGSVRIGKLNGWFLSSESHVKSKDLRRHLDWLIVKLQQNEEGLKALQAKNSVQMCVYCVWWSRYGGGGPTLWPAQMLGLANLNLECTFDFAYYGEKSDVESINPDRDWGGGHPPHAT